MPLELNAATDVAGASPAVDNTPTPSESSTPSMESTILQAYRASKTQLADAQHDAHEPDVIEPKEAKAQRTNAAGRLINERGQFTKADGTVVATEAEAGTEADAPIEGEGAEEPKAEVKPHDTPPNTWKKEAAAEFAKLPENVRQEIHRREQDFHKGIGQYRQAADFASTMAKEMLPYEGEMRNRNFQPAELVKQSLAVWNKLATGTPVEKSSTLLQLAKDFGIDIAPPGAAPPQDATQQTQADPIVAALQRELGEIKSHLTSQERQRAEAEFSSHVETVTSFGSKPEHEHFDAVREDMAALIETGRAKDLQDAYDKAIWANPDVRKNLLDKQQKDSARKQADEAAAARKAAGTNVVRRGTPPAPVKTGTMDDTIRSAYRQLNGGG